MCAESQGNAAPILRKGQQKHGQVVITAMSNKDALATVNACEDGIVVRAPRAGDTIAFALSAVFDSDEGLPDDWTSILAELDRASRAQPQR